MSYGQRLFSGEVTNDCLGQVLDLTRLRGNLPVELTITATVSGAGGGELPAIVLEGADPVRGRLPARPGAFETLVTSDGLDAGTWTVATLSGTQIRRYMRARVAFPHSVHSPFDPRGRNYGGFLIDEPCDPPRATRKLTVVATIA